MEIHEIKENQLYQSSDKHFLFVTKIVGIRYYSDKEELDIEGYLISDSYIHKHFLGVRSGNTLTPSTENIKVFIVKALKSKISVELVQNILDLTLKLKCHGFEIKTEFEFVNGIIDEILKTQ